MKWGVFIRLIRAEDYLKNIVIFAPVFFAGKIFNTNVWPSLFIAFIAFCLISTSIYIFNDYLDRDYDKLHPHKKNRPLAAGQIHSRDAFIVTAICIILGEAVAYSLGINRFWIFQLYIVQNILYSLFLKKIIFVDILIIAFGYVLRIYLGGHIANVPITNWLYGLTILLILTLTLGKRYTDLNSLSSSGIHTRAMIIPYTKSLLEKMIKTILLGTMLVYIAYTIYPETLSRMDSGWYFLTSIPVGVGLLQYAKLILTFKNPGSPVQLLVGDKILKICFVIWLVSVAFFNYLQNV